MTRVRRDVVIWRPVSSDEEPARDPGRFDRVREALLTAGLPTLEDVFLL